jgi:hypothetical protein
MDSPGLGPSVMERLAAVWMIDAHLLTTRDRELLLTRYTEPEETGAAHPIAPENHRRATATDPL